MDGYNCGIYILTFFESYIWNVDMTETIRGGNLEFLRFRVLCILKNHGMVMNCDDDTDEQDDEIEK